MTKIIQGLLYTEEHEWVKVDADRAFIGITDFAANNLGDIVFVELPEVDDNLEKGAQSGVIESVKAVADFFSPVSGTVLEVNEELETSPELLNSDPYEQHLAIVQLKDKSELDDLMDAKAYEEFCNK